MEHISKRDMIPKTHKSSHMTQKKKTAPLPALHKESPKRIAPGPYHYFSKALVQNQLN
jgi:hypothetical protein